MGALEESALVAVKVLLHGARHSEVGARDDHLFVRHHAFFPLHCTPIVRRVIRQAGDRGKEG